MNGHSNHYVSSSLVLHKLFQVKRVAAREEGKVSSFKSTSRQPRASGQIRKKPKTVIE